MIFIKDEQMGSVVYSNELFSSERLRKIIDDIKIKILNQIDLSNSNITVAIMLRRGVTQVATIIALLELGITYVPVDISYPVNRILYMISKANVDYLIADEVDFELEICCPYVDLKNEENVREGLSYVSKNEIAYVLFTSGTTGKPKGVEITCDNLTNFIRAIRERIGISKEDTVVSFTNYIFDIFFLEAVLPVLIGGRVILASEVECRNPNRMKRLILESNANFLQITPSGLRFLEMKDSKFESIQKIDKLLIGGEVFPEELLDKLHKNIKAQIYNLYGPTEATVWTTVSDLTLKDKVDIGTVLDGYEVILMKDGRGVDEGETAEIYIRGKGVAAGYRDEAELNRVAFVSVDGSRYYKTGDLAYYQSGMLYYVGRLDTQIKVNGHRIELDEIDEVIKKYDSEIFSVSCYDEELGLMSFYVADKTIEEVKMRHYFVDILPSYMIPKYTIKVDSFFYTPSGKIDRKAIVNWWKRKIGKM